jgi:probable HAF family extracellular repeat protein
MWAFMFVPAAAAAVWVLLALPANRTTTVTPRGRPVKTEATAEGASTRGNPVRWRQLGVAPHPGSGPASRGPIARYTVVDLGTLGGNLAFPRAMNDRGDVVGDSKTKAGKFHAFFWRNGRIRDLGTLGGVWSRASGINNSGAVVGWAATRPGRPAKPHAFLWINGRITDIGKGKSYDSFAQSINDRGVIAGTYSGRNGGFYACRWDAHGMQPLGGQSRLGVEVNAIDQQGRIVGTVVRWLSDRGADACIWNQRRLTVLPVPPPTLYGMATAINRHGVVVGCVESPRGTKPCVWPAGKRVVCQLLGRSLGSANSINDTGVIVGVSHDGDESRAVAWVSGQRIDLNDTIASSERWTLEHATCINSRGQITGWGQHRGQRRGFLLTPLPR